MIKNNKNFYYRNVHLFCKRVFDLIIIKSQKLIRVNLNICFRNFVFIWYIAAFNRLKRIDFRNFELEKNWIKKLINRFKSNHVIVINSVIVERYIIANVCSDCDSFEYVQQIVSNAKNANFYDIQQQLTWIWRNFDSDLKRDIFMSIANINVNDFLIAVKLKKKMWQKFYEFCERDRDDCNKRRFARQINKSISNSRQIDNCDSYSSFEFFNYYRSSRAYNNQKY